MRENKGTYQDKGTFASCKGSADGFNSFAPGCNSFVSGCNRLQPVAIIFQFSGYYG